jgi:hypothetical protein
MMPGGPQGGTDIPPTTPVPSASATTSIQ